MALSVCAAPAVAETKPKDPKAAAALANAPAAAQPPSAEDLKRRAQALATYTGGQVTVGELEDAIARQNAFMRGRYKDQANLKELLEKTVRFALLGDEAAHRGYDKDELVLQTMKQNAVQQLMKADLDDKLTAASIPKEDIEKYYKEHIDEYMQPAVQRASHVLLASEAEAKAVIEQAKGMDLHAFRQLAREKSIDQATKQSGGDLRYFDAQGKVHGEQAANVALPIAKAVFALKTIGDVAPKPIKTDAGYSVVKLTGQRPAISRKLAEAEETIRIRLWRERRQDASEQLVKKLEAQYKPELHPELMDAIKLEEPVNAGIPAALPGVK
jgi:peptidyl-prolyl cis-trans isomerase C